MFTLNVVDVIILLHTGSDKVVKTYSASSCYLKHPEEGGTKVLRNVILPKHYMPSHHSEEGDSNFLRNIGIPL